MEKETYGDRIRKLEQALRKARDARTQAEAHRDYLQKELQNVEQRIAELGLSPEELENKIQEIRHEIDKLMQQVAERIPVEYLKEAGWKE